MVIETHDGVLGGARLTPYTFFDIPSPESLRPDQPSRHCRLTVPGVRRTCRLNDEHLHFLTSHHGSVLDASGDDVQVAWTQTDSVTRHFNIQFPTKNKEIALRISLLGEARRQRQLFHLNQATLPSLPVLRK